MYAIRSYYDFSKITNESRKKEYLAVRKLLLELTNKDTSIIYSQEGKPKLLNNNNANISITHTKNFVAIIISQKHITGIDIEHISDRVLRIRKKFLDTNELEWCNTVEKHIICWSAKETIFKLFGKNIDFKDIKINTFEVLENTGTINAALIKNTNKQFIVSYSYNFV